MSRSSLKSKPFAGGGGGLTFSIIPIIFKGFGVFLPRLLERMNHTCFVIFTGVVFVAFNPPFHLSNLSFTYSFFVFTCVAKAATSATVLPPISVLDTFSSKALN